MSFRTLMRSVVGRRYGYSPLSQQQNLCFSFTACQRDGGLKSARCWPEARSLKKRSPLGLSKRSISGGSLAKTSRVTIDPPAQRLPPVITERTVQVHRESPDGTIGDLEELPPVWLRDNCQCSGCVHEATKQRLLDTFSIPEDLSIVECHQLDASVRVRFSDGHEGQYSFDFLAKQGLSRSRPSVREGAFRPTLWGREIEKNPPIVDYAEVIQSDNGVKKWTALIREFGFCYVDGCPVTPEATEELLEKIAFIRHTHYGGFWDFTSDLASKDTAYTDIALEAHTDNTYFSDPAGLQLFHLLSHTEGSGGASLLVDGFKAAVELKDKYPKAYEILATVGINSHSSGNQGIDIQPYQSFPVFVHSGERLAQVRWNNSDRAAIDTPVSSLAEWYDAARKWNAILKSHENEYWEQLKPGRPLIFDNWRVLHGRSAFTGRRRLCGGYINHDDFMSRYRVHNVNSGPEPF